MFKRILVPTDGSDISAKALNTAIGMARIHTAKLYVLSVKEPFPYSAVSEMQPTPPQEFFVSIISNVHPPLLFTAF